MSRACSTTGWAPAESSVGLSTWSTQVSPPLAASAFITVIWYWITGTGNPMPTPSTLPLPPSSSVTNFAVSVAICKVPWFTDASNGDTSVAVGSSSETFTPTVLIPAARRALDRRDHRLRVQREHDDPVDLLTDQLVDVGDLLVDVEVGVDGDHLAAEALGAGRDRVLEHRELVVRAERVREPDRERTRGTATRSRGARRLGRGGRGRRGVVIVVPACGDQADAGDDREHER